MNPLCKGIIALFDSDRSGQINFQSFVQVLALFHPDCDKEEKRKAAFRCYDVDGDGVINSEDLFVILKLLVGTNMDDSQLRLIVVKTFESIGVNAENGMTMEEFAQVISEDDILENMTVSFPE